MLISVKIREIMCVCACARDSKLSETKFHKVEVSLTFTVYLTLICRESA